MSSATTDRIKGVVNDVAGKAKQALGKAVDNDRLTAEGIAQQTKGDAQRLAADAKDAVKKAIDKV